jgi:hypothetical protein
VASPALPCPVAVGCLMLDGELEVAGMARHFGAEGEAAEFDTGGATATKAIRVRDHVAMARHKSTLGQVDGSDELMRSRQRIEGSCETRLVDGLFVVVVLLQDFVQGRLQVGASRMGGAIPAEPAEETEVDEQ